MVDHPTRLAPKNRAAEGAGATFDDGLDDLFVVIGCVGKTLGVIRGKGSEERGDGSHDHTSRMTELMIRQASSGPSEMFPETSEMPVCVDVIFIIHLTRCCELGQRSYMTTWANMTIIVGKLCPDLLVNLLFPWQTLVEKHNSKLSS